MSEAQRLIDAQDWTPRILPRRNGRKYLYAERRFGKKVRWCYIGAVDSIESMTEEEIIKKLKKKLA